VKPMAEMGHHIDYYIGLSLDEELTKNGTSLVMHPKLAGLHGKALEGEIKGNLERAGASVRKIVFYDPDAVARGLTKDERSFQDGTSDLGAFLFSSMDAQEGVVARKYLLNRYKTLHLLWSKAKQIENKEEFQYDFIIVPETDILWTQNFEFQNVIEASEELPGNWSLMAYGPGCGAASTVHNNKMWMSGRQAAESLLTMDTCLVNPYSCGFKSDKMKDPKIKGRINPDLKAKVVAPRKFWMESKAQKGNTTFNFDGQVDQFVRMISATRHNVQWTGMRDAKLPVARVHRVLRTQKLLDGEEGAMPCMQKFCISASDDNSKDNHGMNMCEVFSIPASLKM